MNELRIEIILERLAELTRLNKGLSDVAKTSDSVSKQTENVNKSFGRLSSISRTVQGSFGRLRTSAGQLLSTLGRVTGIFAGLGALAAGISFGVLFSRAVRDAANQERVFAALAQAVENTGESFARARPQLDGFIQAIQDTTVFGDTEQAEALTRLVTLTGSLETAQKSLLPVLNLATGLQQDLGSSARLFAQAVEGNISALTRYIPELSKINAEQFRALDQSERLDIVLRALESRFGGLAEIVGNTFTGRITQLRNQFGDLLETVGDFVIRSEALSIIIELITEQFKKYTFQLQDAQKNQQLVGDVSSELIESLIALAKAISFVGDAGKLAFGVIQTAFRGIQTTFAGVLTIQSKALGGFLALLRKITEGINRIPGVNIDDFENSISDAENLIKSFADENSKSFFDFAEKTKSSFDSTINTIATFGSTADRIEQVANERIRPFVNQLNEAAVTAREGRESLQDFVPSELLNDTEDLNNKTKESTKSVKEQTKAIKEQAEAVNELLKQRDDFIKGIANQIIETKNEIEAFQLAAKEGLTLADALLVIRGAELGLEDTTRALVDSLQAARAELQLLMDVQSTGNFINEINFGFSGAFSEEVAEAARKATEAGEDIGKDFAQSLTEGLLNEIRNTLADSLARAFRGELDSVLDVFKEFGRSASQIFAQAISAGALKNIEAGTPFAGGGVPESGAGQAAFFGGPALGAFLGGLENGIQGAIQGGATGLGASAGFFFGGPTGAAIGASIGSAVGGALGSLFEDRSRLDIEVFGLGNQQEFADELSQGIRRTVSDVIELGFEDVFVKSKNGDFGGSNEIRALVIESLTNTVDTIFGIINTLPSEIAGTLRNNFINTQLQFQELADDFTLEFDESSSDLENVAQRFEQFINADLPARFFTSIESFFENALETIGANSEFVSQRLEQISNEESREVRGQLGVEFLNDFKAFVEAFNILNSEAQSEISRGINEVSTLASKFGLEGVPLLSDVDRALDELFESGQLSREVVDDFIRLRQSIIDLRVASAQSISSLSGLLSSLGNTSGIGALGQASGALQGLLNDGGLTLDQRESILNELNSLANQRLEIERQAATAGIERQRAAAESTIRSLEIQRDRQQEIFDARLDSLNQELDIARELQNVVESIQRQRLSLLTGNLSIENPIQRLSRVNSEIQGLFNNLGAAPQDQRASIASEIQELLSSRLDIAGTAFDSPSLAFRDQFRSTIEQLNELESLIEPTRSIEQINTEIEALNVRRNAILEGIESRIESSRQALSSISESTFQGSNEVRRLQQYIEQQAVTLLDLRLRELSQITSNEGNVQRALFDVNRAQLNELGLIRQALVGGNSTGQISRPQSTSSGSTGASTFAEDFALRLGRDTNLRRLARI